MSDYFIPFEIGMKIIEKVSDARSLIRLWSLIKPPKPDDWNPCSCSFISYKKIIEKVSDEVKYICFVDEDDVDNNETLPSVIVSPQIKQYSIKKVVGACHGFMCLSGFHKGYKKRMLVIWNPSIPRSFGILVPNDIHCPVFGFGVRPDTKDPTVVKLTSSYDDKFWKAQVFTLSTGVWNVIPSSNLPRKSILFNESTHVVIDRLIYWGAYEMTFFDDGKRTQNHMLVSFDLITKEFKVLDLPDSLTNELNGRYAVSVCKLRESLVVYGCIMDKAICCRVWVMEHGSSFKELCTIGKRVDNILGFTKSDDPIFVAQNGYKRATMLYVYDRRSEQIKNLGIEGVEKTFFMGSYKEPVLPLDHSNSLIYPDDKDDGRISSCGLTK